MALSNTEFTRTTPPSDQEKLPWQRQLMFLREHKSGSPIDPNNPQLGSDHRSWGIPDRFWPPVDCVEYIMAMFKQKVAQQPAELRFVNGAWREEAYLVPESKFVISAVTLAHFSWFGCAQGAEWLLNFYGVEEKEPHPGYLYAYIQRQTGKVFELGPKSGLKLRIFERVERNFTPPITDQAEPLILELKQLLERSRSPYASAHEPIQHAAGGMYRWASEQIRDWLMEPVPSPSFPYPKQDRLSGPRWAKTVTSTDGSPRYHALSKIDEFGGRAYRIEDKNGQVFWCGPQEISHPPITDVDRSNGRVEREIDAVYRCASCNKIRCCIVSTGTGHRMCRHCVGVQLQKNERSELDWCLYRECKACPDHVSDPERLRLKIDDLNRASPFPVNR